MAESTASLSSRRGRMTRSDHWLDMWNTLSNHGRVRTRSRLKIQEDTRASPMMREHPQAIMLESEDLTNDSMGLTESESRSAAMARVTAEATVLLFTTGAAEELRIASLVRAIPVAITRIAAMSTL